MNNSFLKLHNPLSHALLAVCALVLFATTASAEESAAEVVSPAVGAPLWKDRRPIGRIFVANSGALSEKNPSGYIAAKDVTTPEGRAEFRANLLEFADRCVANLKAGNAQGAIIWDIEGYEFPGMVYVGDPRVLPKYSPAMFEIAPEFFKKFTDAGLKVGFCLRPISIFEVPKDHLIKHGRDPKQNQGYMLYKEAGLPVQKPEIEWFAQAQKDAVKDPVLELSDRIKFAQKHWGATLFYVDTNSYDKNVDGVEKSTLMPPEMFARLAALHPDTLIMPEHEAAGYYATTAPYNQPGVDSTAETPPAIRKKYPGAFLVSALTENRSIPRFWDEYVRGIGGGDVLYFEASDAATAGTNATVGHLYREAELWKKAPEHVRASAESLTSADPAVRLAAVRAISGKPEAALVPSLLALAKADPEWVIRRASLYPLALAEDPAADDYLATLPGDKIDLGEFAMLALAVRGESVTPIFDRVLDQTADEKREARHDAVTGLNLLDSPKSVPPLLRVLQDKYSANRGFALRVLEFKLVKYPGQPARDALLAMRDVAVNKNMIPQIDRMLAALNKKGFGPADATAPDAGTTSDIFRQWNDWLPAKGTPMPPALAAYGVKGWPALARIEQALFSAKPTRDFTAVAFADLLPLTTDANPVVRYQAVAALGASGDARAVELVATMLENEKNPAVKRRMIEALKQLGTNPSALPAIQRINETASPELKPFLEALGK